MQSARLRLTILTAALCAAVVALAAVASAGRQAQALLLPDLVQRSPSQINVRKAVDGSVRLGFASAVVNAGAGPLIIQGRRESRRDPDMTATQLIRRVDGRKLSRPGVGVVQYTDADTHEHWHLLRFDRYTLRRAGSDQTIVADRKTGFCLGDRFEATINRHLAGEPAQPPFTRNCGLDHPDFLRLTEGISVGFGDDYRAGFEGQFIDITGLPSGRYELVHRVNTDGRLAELDYANNASSVLFSLQWHDDPRRVPAVRVVRSCPASQTCVR